MKPEYSEKRKICYIDTESFIAHTKMGEIYNHIAKNFFETRFDTANFELDTLLPKGKKTKKVIDLKKDWLGWVGLRTKTYGYLIEDDSTDKKTKDTKKCVRKEKFKFGDYKNFLKETQLKIN